MQEGKASSPGLSRRLKALAAALMLLTVAHLACSVEDLIVTELPPTETVRGDWIQIYFTRPTASDDVTLDQQTSIPRGFTGAIAEAESTIDLAIYDFALASVADSLIAAEDRGVRVRLVTEGENVSDNRDVLISLQQAGIPVIEDEREGGLMHNKFAVIDGVRVWTGSWNITHNGTHRNNNNAVLITSTALAENYTAEFEEMMARRFGPDSPSDTPNPRLTVNLTTDDGSQSHAEIESLFAPEDQVADQIIAEIEAARERIRFMAFVFTSDDIADAMLRRADAGVIVQGVMESRHVNGQYDEYRRLKSAVHDVLLDGNPYTMHHKVIIIDDETVMLGSYNFSHSAETSNDENLLIVHDPTVAAHYVEEFGRVYEQARKAE
jgi:phosphatidylserine/phosphatidylglycerophosphate/cardiolipin synthase-like enzyme